MGRSNCPVAWNQMLKLVSVPPFLLLLFVFLSLCQAVFVFCFFFTSNLFPRTNFNLAVALAELIRLFRVKSHTTRSEEPVTIKRTTAPKV